MSISATSDHTDSPSSFQSMYQTLLQTTKLLGHKQKRLEKMMVVLHKKFHKEKQRSQKRSSKPVQLSDKKLPSGFDCPVSVSDELAKFLKLRLHQKVSRATVTKKVTQYIRKHKLQCPDNRRRFIPDPLLQSILSPLDTEAHDKNGQTDLEKGYTFFNLQKYLARQFVPKPKPEKNTLQTAA